MEPTVITLKGVEVRLEAPTSIGMRTEVWMASASNQLRAGAAALAMCWQGPHRPKVQYSACGYDVAAFGLAVFDWLIDQGIDHAEVVSACGAAMGVIYRSMPSKAEVDEAVGFTGEEAPPPTSTG
jgi:hypothetical protein